MRSRSPLVLPDRPRVRAGGAAAWLLVALTAVACSSDDGRATADTGHVHMPAQEGATATSPGGAPDRVIAGPQGRVGQFVVECEFSHAATDDPIVWPGQPGFSHLHVFFGNTATDASSTGASLAAGDTTCDQPLDRAAYWAPALLLDGELLPPVKSTAYYRAGPDVDPTTVQPYPAGLAMLAGDPTATEAQPLSVVAWTCGAGIERVATPPSCPAGRNVRLIVTFPDCWDGERADSENHRDHVGYSAAGRCPDDLPVSIAQLQLSIEYPVSGEVEGTLELASGGLLTGHADFLDGWDPDKLAREIRLCLHRGVVCGVASGRTAG